MVEHIFFHTWHCLGLNVKAHVSNIHGNNKLIMCIYTCHCLFSAFSLSCYRIVLSFSEHWWHFEKYRLKKYHKKKTPEKNNPMARVDMVKTSSVMCEYIYKSMILTQLIL